VGEDRKLAGLWGKLPEGDAAGRRDGKAEGVEENLIVGRAVGPHLFEARLGCLGKKPPKSRRV